MAGSIEQLTRQAKRTRQAGRAKEFQKARGVHEGLSRRSGTSAIGLDENGQPMETRTLKGFKIVLDRWYVGMSFKRENQDILEEMTWKEIEKMLKTGRVPRSSVRLETHIVPAVRALKHLRMGYDEELRRTDEMLASLDRLNMELAERKTPSDDEIRAVVDILIDVGHELDRKQVVVKKVVARERLSKAEHMLFNAMDTPQENRAIEIGRVCAVLVSIRNRLGQWRDKQVAGIAEYNLQKECALRAERDRWLFAQFSRFADAGEVVHGYWTGDPEKLEALGSIEQMIRTNVPRDQVLEFISENSRLFRVPVRLREGAEKQVVMCQLGIQPRVGMGIDYMIGHYAWLYRFVAKGEMRKAEDKARYLRLFVKANKPDYILQELRKDPDPYLIPVIGQLGEAVAAFEAGDIQTAQKHFAACRDLIRPFAYHAVSE